MNDAFTLERLGAQGIVPQWRINQILEVLTYLSQQSVQINVWNN